MTRHKVSTLVFDLFEYNGKFSFEPGCHPYVAPEIIQILFRQTTTFAVFSSLRMYALGGSTRTIIATAVFILSIIPVVINVVGVWQREYLPILTYHADLL